MPNSNETSMWQFLLIELRLTKNYTGCFSGPATIQGFQRAYNSSFYPHKPWPSSFQPRKETQQFWPKWLGRGGGARGGLHGKAAAESWLGSNLYPHAWPSSLWRKRRGSSWRKRSQRQQSTGQWSSSKNHFLHLNLISALFSISLYTDDDAPAAAKFSSGRWSSPKVIAFPASLKRWRIKVNVYPITCCINLDESLSL